MSLIQTWLRKYDFIFVLIIISTCAYLPNIQNFGYFRDDWYLMYSANTLGADVFHGIYAVDRPIRAFVMSLAYTVFGINPLYYNLSAYVFRVVGAILFWKTLQIIWKEQKYTNAFAVILFLIFPGFISTPNAIDYQSQQISLLLASLSIYLTAKIQSEQRWLSKYTTWLVIAFTSFVYLGLVEYFLGLEVFRFVIIFVILNRTSTLSFIKKIIQAFISFLPVAIGTISFLIWRFFIFESERNATDLSAQLAQLLDSPLLVSIEWMRTLIKDILEITLLSWWLPVSNLWGISLRLRDVLSVVVISAIVIGVVYLFFKKTQSNHASDENTTWQKEAFWIGITTIIAGFIPVILSNRDANFDGLSRYMLASSLGAVILISAFLSQLRSKHVYLGVTCLFVVSAVLTHYLNGLAWARSSEAMQNFWWQVSWRIPQIEESTTLVVNYSHTAIEEDYFIWGPANFIYYPESKNNQKVEPVLWGLVLNRENAISILNQASPEFLNRRSIITYIGYDDILILSQPTASSCVQVIDGRLPFVSEFEQYDIQTIASESNQANVLLTTNVPVLPEIVFDAEPEHTWCYYYQTASLAFQKGDYEAVLDIKKKATKQGFEARDAVEWMFFLQAAILLEDYDEANDLARFIKKSPFLQVQACNILPKMQNLDETGQDFIQKTFCIK